MASLNIEPEELRVLEQLRQRLSLLVNNFQSLREDVNKSSRIPSASSLQASNQILNSNLRSLSDVMTENSDLMQRLVIRPSSNFPGRTQEAILTQLLRKKAEPQVEERRQRGRAVAAAAERMGSCGTNGVDEKRELWDEAADWANARIARYVRDEAWSLFTADEKAAGIETVQTGLKRDLVAEEREREKALAEGDEHEEEEEEEEDDEEEDDDEDIDDEEEEDIDGKPKKGGARRRVAGPVEELFLDVAQSSRRLPMVGRIRYIDDPEDSKAGAKAVAVGYGHAPQVYQL